jgi:hypothetical protein
MEYWQLRIISNIRLIRASPESGASSAQRGMKLQSTNGVSGDDQ